MNLPVIPELLLSASGKPVKTAAEWENFRRREIQCLFEEFVYGIRPIEKPSDISFKIKAKENYLGENITYKEIDICFSHYSFKVHGFLPPKTAKKIPAFVYVMHEYECERCNITTDIDCEFVDIREIIKRGFAVFIMPTYPIAADWEHDFHRTQGVFPVLDIGRTSASWATISAWSWGASRVLDYLETDEQIDTKKVTVAGHSRGGKTALWAGATDKRFFCAISNDSGCTGAAVLRGKTGEHIKEINRTDWFCENYRLFDDNEDFLPVDQHMLVAMLAPRYCYVASASEDDWADPAAERLACRLASEAYALYNKKGVVLPEENEIENDTAYHDGSIGYHVKTGPHSIGFFDWKLYLDFIETKIKAEMI